MSHALQDQRPTRATRSAAPSGLTRGGLPRWAPAGIAVLSVALGSGIGLVFGLQSKIQWGLLAALLFVTVTYTASAVVENRRQAKDRVATSVVWVCFILAVIPLLSLMWTTVSRGIEALDGDFLSHSMNGVTSFEEGGGVYHALLGTLEQVALATLIAAPIGLLTAVYLVEYGRGALAKAVTFFVDVMTGIPSIVAGLFILTTWNLMLGFGPSGFMRRHGPVDPDDARRGPLHRGDAQARPERAPRGRPRPRCAEVAHDPQGRPAHRHRRHLDRCHAGSGTHRR